MVLCASSACGVSVEHLNAKEPMIRSICRFHVFFHVRRILNILEIPLPYENSFNQYNYPYNYEKFIGICGEYGVSNDLTKWRNQKYFSTWQSRAWEAGKPGMSYINENSFSRWLIEKWDGLTMLGLQNLSESVRNYAYLILTSQTSMRGPIVGHEARNLDAQRTFLNTFENIVNRRVNIPEDIRRFQKTLQYARSKVDYVIGEFVYMLPSNMNLRIGKVKDYNNKILISSPSFKIELIEKSDGLTMLGLQNLSESVRNYAYLILTSQTSMRGPIVGHEARNLDAQRTFLNTFENIVNRRVNIPEDIRRFQKTLQYARSKVDYVIGEFVYMLPSNMNLRIGKVKDYNNKILISSPSFKIELI